LSVVRIILAYPMLVDYNLNGDHISVGGSAGKPQSVKDLGVSDFLNRAARAMGHASYAAYLRSDHWQQFTAAVRQRNCYCCAKKGRRLAIHHLTYIRLGCELPKDVITVCCYCHERIHDLVRAGIDMDQAHYRVRSEMGGKRNRKRRRDNGQRWANLSDLVSWRRGETLEGVREHLTRKGLLEGGRPSREAVDVGMAKLGTKPAYDTWDRRKYGEFKWAEQRLEWAVSNGKRVGYELMEDAWETPDSVRQAAEEYEQAAPLAWLNPVPRPGDVPLLPRDWSCKS
jgi:hypothetical protein